MKLINISKKYKKYKALEDINLDFSSSNVIGLIGKNGAGKTTIMKIIINNIINYNGIIEDSNHEIGYLIENPKLYNQETGLENLKIFSNIKGDGYDSKYSYDIINAFGMEEYINKKVKNYSMGMKQKLAIAISLMNKPEYLILDEPTNGMDPDGSIDVLTTIKNIGENLNTKILISSHKLEDIELICDRAVFIQKGHIIKDIDLLYENHNEKTHIKIDSKDLKKAIDTLSLDYKIDDVSTEQGIIIIPNTENTSKILKKLYEVSIFPESIEKKKTSLRDTYFNLNNKKGDKI